MVIIGLYLHWWLNIVSFSTLLAGTSFLISAATPLPPKHTPFLILWHATWVHNSEKASKATEELILSILYYCFVSIPKDVILAKKIISNLAGAKKTTSAAFLILSVLMNPSHSSLHPFIPSCWKTLCQCPCTCVPLNSYFRLGFGVQACYSKWLPVLFLYPLFIWHKTWHKSRPIDKPEKSKGKEDAMNKSHKINFPILNY